MGGSERSAKNPLHRLAVINRAITTSLNFEEALRLLVENAAELFSADNSLLLLAEGDGVLRVRAAYRAVDDSSQFSGVMEEAVIRDLASHLKLHSHKELVTVPIVCDGTIDGFLAIIRESPLTTDESWQLSALADQAAIALNNARLHEFQTGEAIRQRDELLAALRESNRKVNNILESITDLYYQLDREWRFTDINRQTVTHFQKRREELLGQVIWEVFPVAVDSDLYTNFHKAIQSMVPVHFELASKIVPGTWFEAHAYPSSSGLAVYLRNITERKASDEAIAFQAHLLSAVEQAVIATDLEGKIISWNSFAEKLYGWSEAEAVGANILNVTPAEEAREKANEVMSLLREGKSWFGEFMVQRKDGSTFPVLVTNSPIFNEQHQLVGIVGVSVDITDRRNAEAERERLHQSERDARAEAEKANRLKDEFLATLSHELRNPLNVVLGYAEVLLRSDEARVSQLVRRAAEVLKRNALAQSRLVRDLLDLSRLHVGRFSLSREVVSLVTILNNAVETVSDDAAAKEITIEFDTPQVLVFVDADPLRLEQVLWNLLNNAVKFTPPRGTVSIRMKVGKGHVRLTIEDNGPGIKPEFLPHVFEMFRQADASSSRPHGGMGIGLALVRQLIGLHGGTVEVESILGQGAKFTIELPVTGETDGEVELESNTEAGALGKLRILVVDDSEDTVDMLARLFELEGATVKTAPGGAEALEVARSNDFDVVLSDISMPEMDGFEFVRRLREIERQKDVPVIAVTGFGRAEDVSRARAEGFFSHVTKPIDVAYLIETLSELPVNRREGTGSPTP